MNSKKTTTASAISRVLKAMNYEPKYGSDNIGFSVTKINSETILVNLRGYDNGQPESSLVSELIAKGYEARQDAAWTDIRYGTRDKIRIELVSVCSKVGA
jgi:hypothetical protein